MSVEFVDTNVLLYAISKDAAGQAKTQAAREVLNRRSLVLSAQVLQEFYVQATRASRPDRLEHRQAADLVRSFGRFPVQAVTASIVEAAMETREHLDLSYWDAAIIEAARAAGAETVLSEDLSDGQDYDGVRVVDPFATT